MTILRNKNTYVIFTLCNALIICVIPTSFNPLENIVLPIEPIYSPGITSTNTRSFCAAWIIIMVRIAAAIFCNDAETLIKFGTELLSSRNCSSSLASYTLLQTYLFSKGFTCSYFRYYRFHLILLIKSIYYSYKQLWTIS